MELACGLPDDSTKLRQTALAIGEEYWARDRKDDDEAQNGEKEENDLAQALV